MGGFAAVVILLGVRTVFMNRNDMVFTTKGGGVGGDW